MPRNKRYHCLNCGFTFETEVLDREEADRRRVRLSPVQCPKCNHTDLRDA